MKKCDSDGWLVSNVLFCIPKSLQILFKPFLPHTFYLKRCNSFHHVSDMLTFRWSWENWSLGCTAVVVSHTTVTGKHPYASMWMFVFLWTPAPSCHGTIHSAHNERESCAHDDLSSLELARGREAFVRSFAASVIAHTNCSECQDRKELRKCPDFSSNVEVWPLALYAAGCY